MTSSVRAIEILLVEDSPSDVRLVKELLAEAKVMNAITVAEDGEAALRLLRGGPEVPPYRPDLILLDLNLPRKTGHEVLAEVKSDDTLRSIPVVVLTTSDQDTDVVRSYKLSANAYVVKPVDLTRLVEIVHAIDAFWLAVVRLPARPDATVSGTASKSLG